MLPNGLLLTNKVLFALFTFGIAYNYFEAESLDAFRVVGWFLGPMVLLLTIVAAVRGKRRLVLSALIANTIVCLVVTGTFLMAAFGGQLWGGVAIAVVFVPFFFNTYFLARHKSGPLVDR